MKRSLLSLPLSLLLIQASAQAASLTIDQAVSEGLDHSPQVQQAQAASDQAGWQKTETLSGFLPSVNLAYEHFFLEKYELLNIQFQGNPVIFPTIYPVSTATINATVPIFDGLQNIFTLQAASSKKTSAEESYSWTSYKVAQGIRLNFLKSIAAQKLQAVSQENLKTISDHLDQTQSLKQGGVATNYDVLRVEVQLSEAKSGVLQADDNVELSRKQLAISMGLDADDRGLEGDLPIPDAKSVEAIANPEQPARADLAALSDQAEAAQKTENAAATYLVPRVSLAAQWLEYNNLDSSWSNANSYRSAYNMGLLFTWNLFDGMASISKSREAVYQKIQAEKSLEQAKLQVPYDFDFWKRRYVYSASLYESRKSDVVRSEESVRLAREGFKAGTRTSTEVLDAELDLFRARAGVVNAQMDCAEAKINLELALGRRI